MNQALGGTIRARSSKSLAHRAIFCALLAPGSSRIVLKDLSQDIERSLAVARALQVDIKQTGDTYQFTPPAQFPTEVEINVGESGTTLRFLLPVFAVLGVRAKIIREGSLIQRPNTPYFSFFKAYGVRLREEGAALFLAGRLPAFRVTLPGNLSSQFISGCLLAAGYLEEPSEIKVQGELESKAYVHLTIEVMRAFGVHVEAGARTYHCQGPYEAASYQVEGDWSNGLFFLAAGVRVTDLTLDSRQACRLALGTLNQLGYEVVTDELGLTLKPRHTPASSRSIDARQMPDAIPILAVLAARTPGRTQVIHGERLRLKESDRLQSTAALLRALGVPVVETTAGLDFRGVSRFQPTQVRAFNDHRLAMAAAIAATWAAGPIELCESESVQKSYPEFFHDFNSLGGKSDVL